MCVFVVQPKISQAGYSPASLGQERGLRVIEDAAEMIGQRSARHDISGGLGLVTADGA